MSIERGKFVNKKMASFAAAGIFGVAGACEHTLGKLDFEEDYNYPKCDPIVLYEGKHKTRESNELIQLSQEVAPVWHLSKEEEMEIFFGIDFNQDKNKAIFAFAAMYKEGDRGGNGLGIAVGDFYRGRFPGGAMSTLNISHDSHHDEIEMAYVGLTKLDGNKWDIEKVFIARHGDISEYDKGEFGCESGSHIALFVDDGKHATYTSPEECNKESVFNLMGIAVGTASVCIPIDSNLPILNTNGYLSRDGDITKLRDDLVSLQNQGYLLTEDFWTDCVLLEDHDECRRRFGFNRMSHLLEKDW